MKAVIYARYSSDNQTETSIEGQLRECMEYATYNDIQVIGNYIDRAFSAKTDHRPEFQRMIKDSYKHAFDCIIVWKLDRFSRNRYDSAHYKALLRKNGVKVISAKETIAEGSEGILLESVLEGMAEYYSAELAEKVTRGMKENALKGLWNGGNVPFGYVINKERKLDIDPQAAPVVQEIFKLSNDGKTVKEIYNIMNERKVTRSNGKALRYNAIRYMLSSAVGTCQELKGAGKAFSGRRLPAHHQTVLRAVRSNDGCADGNERHEGHCLSLLRLCAAEETSM